MRYRASFSGKNPHFFGLIQTPACLRRLLAGAGSLALAACGGETGSTPESVDAPETTPIVEAPARSASQEKARFRELVERHARETLQADPEFATRLGVSEEIAGTGYGARLSSRSFNSNQEARAANEAYLTELNAIDRGLLGASQKITYDILQNAYETGARRNQFEFGAAARFGHTPPYRITQLSGVHLSLPQLMQTQHPLKSADDIEDYLSRLIEMSRVFDEVSERVRAEAEFGVLPPPFALEGASKAIASFVAAAPADSPLVTTFANKIAAIEGIDKDAREGYVLRAIDIVEADVYPAYSRMRSMLNDLMPQSLDGAGIWRIGARGEAFYQHALDAYGANGMTGEEIHELGLAEVKRITDEMDAILRAEGLEDGSVAERFKQIAARPGNVYPNTAEGRDALLAGLREQVDEIMALAGDWFKTLPAQPVEVRRIPVYEQDSSAGGYYTGPSLDGSRPGIYWINLKDTADWPKHTLKTLTYHEAVPGHHFQISLQRAIDNMPLIRNMMFFSEFSEGWALYAEKVAAEMGMYDDDPMGNLGRLQSELFRAARLVVDSGLHAKQWTREEAIDYMVGVTGDTRAAVTREVERYAVWPGQATSYKLGMIQIEKLRREAEDALGEGFDVRAFHDAVLLDGAMPLPVLERKIRTWIAAQR